MKKLKVILIGAGGRGSGYTNIMADMPDKFQVVAVADPHDKRRNYIKEKHNLPDDKCFTDWRPLVEKGKIADVAIIGTMDRDHLEPSLATISLGYDLLLEKPIAPTPQECKQIADAAKKYNSKVVICTVLRYTHFYKTIKNLIDSGRLGNIVSVVHEECVGNEHQSHSFVRGNWGNEEKSSPMLLQKSCHDIDILQWLIGKKCKKVQSFGSLSYFIPENAPEGAPMYCVEGCPAKDTCFYNAEKIYIENNDEDNWFRAHAAKIPEPDNDTMREVISTTNYGKCVFKCDNNVVDHQTVNMLFEDDITVMFSMCCFNKGARFTHIMGTKGELHAPLDTENPIRFYDFATRKTEEIPLTTSSNDVAGGHAGGDDGIINDFYDYVTGNYEGKSIPDISESYMNHLITFAAEEARKTGKIIDIDEYINSL